VIERTFAEQPAPMRSRQSFEPTPIDAELTFRLYRELLVESWLSPWERSFLQSLLEKEAVILSAKQEICLRRIIRKHAAAAKAREECHAA
jgi:hypothetical protein